MTMDGVLNQFQESIDTFKVKFEGNNSIDAELFVNSINHTLALVKESAIAINPNAFLRLEIKTMKDGSFETIIDAVAKYTPDLINKDNARLAAEIIGGFLAFLQIKQLLKGGEPKKIEVIKNDSIITNQDNQTIKAPTNIVNNYFNNSSINNSIVHIFNELELSDREGFVVEHGTNKVEFKRTDYRKMKSTIHHEQLVVVTKKETRLIKDCELTIKKPDLIGHSKWEVIFDRKIDVKIADEEFLTRIREGIIKISGGYKLVCNLEIQTEIDSEYNAISVEYTVVMVHGIKDKEEQLNLFKTV